MTRIGRFAIGALVPVVVAVGLVGCSSDDGQVVVTDDSSPEDVLATAAATTFEGTGRFRGELRLKSFGVIHQEGEFSGDDVAVRVQVEPSPESLAQHPTDPDLLTTERRTVDGRSYARSASMDRWQQAPDSSESSEYRPDQISDVLRHLDGIEETGADDVDGDPVTTYAGRVDPAELDTAFGASSTRADEIPEDQIPPDLLRMRRLSQLALAALDADVTVAIDDDGRLRHLVVEVVGDLPAELADCAFFEQPGGDPRIRVELTYFDLGADVTIEAPDPALVDDGFIGTLGEPEDASSLDPEMDMTMLETSDGPIPRMALQFALIDAAVLGDIALDPSTVEGLPDDVLVSRFEDLKAIRGGDVWDGATLGSSEDDTTTTVLDAGEAEGDSFDDVFAGCPA